MACSHALASIACPFFIHGEVDHMAPQRFRRGPVWLSVLILIHIVDERRDKIPDLRGHIHWDESSSGRRSGAARLRPARRPRWPRARRAERVVKMILYTESLIVQFPAFNSALRC